MTPRSYSSTRHPFRPVVAMAAGMIVLTVCLMPTATPWAQKAQLHLNPVIDKLARGETVFGVSTSDFSVESAHSLARSNIDYVYLDMEHQPAGTDVLRTFLTAMIDKQAILKKGNAQPDVAVFARFPPYAREGNEWVVKQALDSGLMGVLFNTVETKEQAMRAVRQMRYPQVKGARYFEPAGLRGHGTGFATWLWGLDEDEYMQHADVWPLNPDGDLLALMMIESAAGVKNINEIASVPGATIYIGGGSDLSLSLGVYPNLSSPETEAARQTVLDACRAQKVLCGGNVIPASDVPKRIKEGYKLVNVGGSGPGLSAGTQAILRAGREATKK